MPYIGEIRMFAGTFAPEGWLLCQGQTLPISEYDVLFNLIGTTYGGDGQSTFNLPDLSSRLPIHTGTSFEGNFYPIGQLDGTERETLAIAQMPTHTHAELASNAPASDQAPTGKVLALPSSTQPNLVFWGQDSVAPMNSDAIQPAGESQPHENAQPFLCINFIISLYGQFPTPT